MLRCHRALFEFCEARRLRGAAAIVQRHLIGEHQPPADAKVIGDFRFSLVGFAPRSSSACPLINASIGGVMAKLAPLGGDALPAAGSTADRRPGKRRGDSAAGTS